MLSYSQIFQTVRGYDFGLRSNNLWVYMGYLRVALGPRLDRPQVLCHRLDAIRVGR